MARFTKPYSKQARNQISNDLHVEMGTTFGFTVPLEESAPLVDHSGTTDKTREMARKLRARNWHGN